MKKVLIIAISVFVFTNAINAQAKQKDSTVKKEVKYTKEQKELFKAKQIEELNTALKEAGLNEEEAAKAKEILQNISKKSSELKNNTTLTDADKDLAKKALNNDKNTQLKNLMGAERFKAYSEIRKKQKANQETTAPAKAE